MIMHTYGREGAPVILMLQPMGISAEMLYKLLGSKFKGDYHILIPDMGGHGDEVGDFISADIEAEHALLYLKSAGITEITLLYGASIGAAVALRMLDVPELKVKNIFLDSAPVARFVYGVRKVFGPVVRMQRAVYLSNLNNDAKRKRQVEAQWGRELGDHISKNFAAFSSESLTNMVNSCVQGNMPAIPEEQQKHTFMEWGECDVFSRISPKVVSFLYPDVNICVRPGYQYCEFMVKYTDRYVAFLDKIASGKFEYREKRRANARLKSAACPAG